MWWLPLLLLQDPAQLPPRISQDVVVSAATQPVPLDTLARAVFVLTREQIAMLPAFSIAELFGCRRRSRCGRGGVRHAD